MKLKITAPYKRGSDDMTTYWAAVIMFLMQHACNCILMPLTYEMLHYIRVPTQQSRKHVLESYLMHLVEGRITLYCGVL